MNAIHAGCTDPSPEPWQITQAFLEREITKAVYSGEKAKRLRRIGFCVCDMPRRP